MCLLCTTKTPFVAAEDFKVRKVVMCFERKPTTWRGAYNLSPKCFPFDKEIQEGPFEISRVAGSNNIYEIQGGCFHSVVFDDLTLALGILRMLNEQNNWNYVMCECTIPKGTEYYTDGSVIASRKIIVHKPEEL